MHDTAAMPPNLLDRADVALRGICADGLALVIDFDGTLSEFVPVLENAVIHPAAVPPLRSLAGRLPLTAVMSGRAARDVERRVGIEGMVYIGNHGAERIVDGALTTANHAAPAASDLQTLLDKFGEAANDPGIVLENKGFSASLHYRRVVDEAVVIERLQSALDDMQDSSDFEFFWGNKLLEIRRKGSVNKGTALSSLIEAWRPRSVIFLGDDTTDVDALRVLMQRRASGVIHGLGVVVIQDGTPASALENADYSLDGVPQVAEFLRRLEATYCGM